MEIERVKMEKKNLIEFYDARDLFLGAGNFYGQKPYLAKGYWKLKLCQHPEAIHLIKMLGVVSFNTNYEEQIHKLLLSHTEDPIALCYIAFLDYDRRDLLKKAAEKGHSLAQARVAMYVDFSERMKWANLSSQQDDRYGLWVLGMSYEHGVGCKKNLDLAKKAYKKSAELGYCPAIYDHGRLGFNLYDAERYYWLGMSALVFSRYTLFISEMVSHLYDRKITNFSTRGVDSGYVSFSTRNIDPGYVTFSTRGVDLGYVNNPVVFMIGRMLKLHGNVQVGTMRIFDQRVNSSQLDCAGRAIQFFNSCYTGARNATFYWLLISRRLKFTPHFLSRDVALLIAHRVWDLRANWICSKSGDVI